MIDSKILARNIAIVILFIGIVSYSFWRGRTAIFGVVITTDVQDGEVLSTDLVTLSGNAKNASHFTVNGREVLLDKDGNFLEPLLLPPGYSIIELAAEDHFGRKQYKLLHVYEKEGVNVDAAISS